jgi:outer membrane immunogenic protein
MSATINFRHSAFAAASLLAIFTAPVFAADVVENVPEPAAPMEEAPLASWGGAYAGVYGDYAFSGEAHDKTNSNKIGVNGFGGGAFAGYNYDTGSGVVAGVEADLGYHDIHGDNAGTRVDGGVGGSLRARLGYAITPDIMPYVTAGGAAQSIKVTNGGVSDRNTHLGWTAGGGVDFKITENVFARGEYRYTDLGNKTYTTGAGAGDVSVHDNRVTFGVGMKF